MRPDYALIYHFGGDLLAGAINHICKIDILTSFELISGLFSGVTFFSFFSLAWILTKNYKLSLISAFCCFFGNGFTWLKAILEGLNNPQTNFWIYFLKKGIHNPIIYPPSLTSFSSTSSIGYPVLLLCLFLFWNLLQNNQKQNLKTSIANAATIIIPLFSLSLFAGWLSLTFILSVLTFISIMFITKKKSYLFSLLNTACILILFFMLNKLLGNQMYSQDQFLGRSNIFDLSLKHLPFTITTWKTIEDNSSFTTIISCFSWEFISAFCLSLLLFPIIFIYLNKIKDSFPLLLFLCAALTMPLPTMLEFNLNPVDFNRLFGFGNTMLILLISCGIGTLFPSFFKNKLAISAYLLLFCLSPFLGFILGGLFSPQIYFHPKFTESSIQRFNKMNSLKSIFKEYIEINKDALLAKNTFRAKYKNEIKFFNTNAKPKDVAISSLPGVPIFSGVYTLIPSMVYGLKGQIYSNFDNIYPTIILTLDPNLLSELNIKWIGYDELSKSKLPKETLTFLNNMEVFELVYKNKIMPEENKELLYEIYHVNDLSKTLEQHERATAWILVNKDGFPIEITNKLSPNISLFLKEIDALKYLKELHMKFPETKKNLITAQPIIIKTTKEQLAQSGLNIMLEEKL